MDVDLFKTFLEIYKTRHFGRAADNLFLTQSAVSARIRQLEQEIGIKLFIRDRNNIRPTAAGEKLVKYAEDMLNTWNRAKTNIAISSDKKMPLNVGAVSSLGDIYLNRWLLRFADKFNDILLNCQVLDADVIRQKIKNSTLDFGFTYNPPQDGNTRIFKKLPIKFIMVSSKNNLKASEAIQNNYIFIDWGTSFSEAHSQHFQDTLIPLMRINAGRIAKRFMKSHAGTAYLPETMVKRDLENERLFMVSDAPEIKRNAYIIYNDKNERAVKVKNRLNK